MSTRFSLGCLAKGVIALCLLRTVCVGADPQAALEKLLSESSPIPAQARHLLLQLDSGVTFLTNRLSSSDYKTASQALEILCYGFAGDSTQQGRAFVAGAMPALLNSLSAENQAVRSRALWLVGNLGAQAEPALPLLFAAAGQPESGRYIIKKAAIKSIGEIGCRPEQSLRLVASLLDHQDPEVVRFALIAIGRFESEARSLLPRLLTFTGDANPDLAKAAHQAIDRLQLLPKPIAGDAAPDFTLPKVLGDEPLRLSEHRGKLILLDFWATTCPPCMAPLEKYEKLLQENSGAWKGKLEIIAISMDPDLDAVRKHMKKWGWGRVTHLWGGKAEEVARAYRLHGLPDTLLINAQGTILWRGHPVDLDFAAQAQDWITRSNRAFLRSR